MGERKPMSKVAKVLTENTIIHALDKNRLEQEKAQFGELTWGRKIQKGIISELKTIPKSLIFTSFASLSLAPFARKGAQATLSIANLSIPKLLVSTLLIGPIFEEVVFRGVIQNSIKFLSNKLSSLTENRTIHAICSPTSTILSTNTLYALRHLAYSGNYLCTTESIVQLSTTFVFPSFSIKQETSENLLVPISMHMMRNAFTVIPYIFLRTFFSQ